jgi:hypothetical protein
MSNNINKSDVITILKDVSKDAFYYIFQYILLMIIKLIIIISIIHFVKTLYFNIFYCTILLFIIYELFPRIKTILKND